MTKCYFFGANEITTPNQKWTVKGKRRGMKKNDPYLFLLLRMDVQ